MTDDIMETRITTADLRAAIERELGELIENATNEAAAQWREQPGARIDDRRTLEAIALDMITHLGVTFLSEDGEQAVLALCSVIGDGAVLAAHDRLAIEPILDLARAFVTRQDVQPHRGVSLLARAVRTGHGRLHVQLVEAIAMCVAKGLDDCEIQHEITVDVRKLHVNMLERAAAGQPYEAPEMPSPFTSTVEVVSGDIDLLERERAAARSGMISIPPQHAGTQGMEAAMRLWRSGAQALGDLEKTEPGDFDASANRCTTAPGFATRGADDPVKGLGTPKQPVTYAELRHVLERECAPVPSELARLMDQEITAANAAADAKEAAVDRDGYGGIDRSVNGPVTGLNESGICPQCAAPMSAGPGDIRRCSNGHEHTGMHLAALAGLPIADRASARAFPPPPKRRK